MTRWRFAIGLCLAAILWAGAAWSQAASEDEIGPAVEDEPVAPVGDEQSAPAGEQDAAPEQGSALELLPAIQGIEAAIRNLVAQEDAAEREAERRRNDADLSAQQAMARWAFWATLAAGASVFLTAVGVLLIWRTLRHTKRAADAAYNIIDETRSIGEAQIRAYLYCRSAKYRLARDSVTAILELENTGQSPASNVSIGGTATIHEVGGFPSRSRVTAWVGSKMSSVLCQPITARGNITEEITFFWEIDFALEDGDDPKFKNRIFRTGNEVWFDLVVRWSDVFSKKHEFRLDLSGIIDAHPLNPKKKRSRSGSLDFRMADARHSIVYDDEAQSD